MRLELSTLRSAAAPGPSAGLMSQWRVGAIVDAVAVRGVDGQLWLTIGSLRVPARIASGDAAGPTNGERLQLRVLRDSPVIALESIDAGENDAATIDNGLRHFLPRQSSPAPLLANLAWLTDEANYPTSLPKAVNDAVQRLWRALPDAQDLATPGGLATAVKRSGVFLENQLANGGTQDLQTLGSTDLKALLSSFKQLLVRVGATAHHGGAANPGPMPTHHGALAPLESAEATLANVASTQSALNELAQQTDGALARINTAQLVNAESASLNAAWVLELPLRRDGDPEMLRFRFERSAREPGSQEFAWTVEAAMDLGVGALHARVSLQGSHVGIQLRTDSSALNALLQARSGELADLLRDAGLQVDRIQCLQGLPTDHREILSTPLLGKPLLDIRV